MKEFRGLHGARARANASDFFAYSNCLTKTCRKFDNLQDRKSTKKGATPLMNIFQQIDVDKSSVVKLDRDSVSLQRRRCGN